MRVILGVLIFFSTSILAQDFNDYQLLTNEGDLPEDFTTSSSVKYEKEIAELDKALKRKEKKDQSQFFLESNYTIDDLLLSGQVFYNNEVTRYVNKVADKVLKDNPAFRKQLRIYVVRSSAVNAFATNQGIILVNMGLLAQLENEAQLAYILCHEMVHVKHAHALDMFLEAKDIDRNTERSELLKKTNYSDALVAKNHYSKELETEADDKGLDLYLKTEYSLDALDGVFDVLQYSYLPFDEVAFDKIFFNNEFITISSDYYMSDDEFIPIELLEHEKKEESSTHPSIRERRKKISKRIRGVENKGRQDFLLPQQDFEKTRKIARYELLYYYLRAFRYQDAIYSAYLLMKENPNAKYLKITIAKALYGFTRLKENYSSLNIENAKTIFESKAHRYKQGASQQVYFLFNEIKQKELVVLGLRYIWDLKVSYPNDKGLDLLYNDMFDELIKHYDLNDFSSKSPSALAKDTLKRTIRDTIGQKLSKYDKIKKQKKTEAIEDPDFGTYAFWDIINESSFQDAFFAAKDRKKYRKEIDDFYSSNEGRKKIKAKEKKGASLGIDSVLAITPYYLRLDAKTDKIKARFIRSEENQLKLCKQMQNNAKLAKVHLEILDANQLTAENSEEFNNIVIIKDWLAQQSSLGDVLMPSFNQESMDVLMEKHGTRYLMLSGIISMKKSKKALGVVAPIGLAIISFGIFLPYTIYSLATPNFNMLYYVVLFDTKTQRYEVLKYDFFGKKDTQAIVNSHMYDVFHQIKRTPKKNKK